MIATSGKQPRDYYEAGIARADSSKTREAVARLRAEGLSYRVISQRLGITKEWRGKPLSMELHHVNGDGRDNRLENLRLLCGNCHAQTDNWGGRGRKRRRQACRGV